MTKVGGMGAERGLVALLALVMTVFGWARGLGVVLLVSRDSGLRRNDEGVPE